MTHDQLPLAVSDRTVEAILFDWDGTAVPDRSADAAHARALVEALCAAGVHIFVISGTHVGNIDGQLRARPTGRGRLHLCLNRGSEVYAVGDDGPVLVWRRAATAAEEGSLDRAAAATVDALVQRGLVARLVSQRLNRRKIDLIPEPAWAEPPKAKIAELLTAVSGRLRGAGIQDPAEVVALARAMSTAEGLPDPRITSDVKHVEIGLTDKSDSARWAAGWLATRGITGGLVLIGGDELGPLGGVAGSDSLMLVDELARAVVVSVGAEPGGCPAGVLHLPGGPPRFLEVLDAQLERRRARRVPSIDHDPAWVVALPGDPARERVNESLGALVNGWAGTRGAVEEAGPGTNPLFLVSGEYTPDETSALIAGPRWTAIDVPGEPSISHRLLDLRTGVLLRSKDDDSRLRTARFMPVSRAHGLAMRAEAALDSMIAPGAIGSPTTSSQAPTRDARASDRQLARSAPLPGRGISVAARDWSATAGTTRVIERLAAWAAGADADAAARDAHTELDELDDVGFDALLAEQRTSWAERWADAAVVIGDAPDDELAARFAVFHLLSCAPDEGEAAVGARGLTGAAYGGHVFWDADVFVLPALAALRPQAARAVLEYRIRRLPAARAAAQTKGLSGARFPWESAADGTEVTPKSVRGPRGETVAIMTGAHEEHIVADVAWAACTYAAWSGDAELLSGPGRDLVMETARWWAGRIRRDADGRGHLYGVMGPDEYHTVVDDNAFTNLMARWNLTQAADLCESSSTTETAEAARWRDLAASLVTGYDPATGIYEQFAGYARLEPLFVARIATPPVAADVLLGPERTAGSQVIKQDDVLMAHHLLPNDVAPGSLVPNLTFYEPRTAHGSSLSPAIHASLLARAGQPDRALELFRVAARLDLDDLTGTTAGGLHLAAMGGVWQALAVGFLGLRPADPALEIDPCLPAAWPWLELRFHFRGEPIGVRADRRSVTVSCNRPLTVRVGGGPDQRCDPPGRTYPLEGGAP
ncbi:MAG: glycosyl hydrolase family 65 protein [Microthrixaceae bacterium]